VKFGGSVSRINMHHSDLNAIHYLYIILYYNLLYYDVLYLYCSPEAVVDIDGLYYNVGGLLTHMPRAYLNRTALAENVTFDPSAFHFVSFQTGKPEAPFHYRPRRGAPEDIVWPPHGLRVDVQFKAPFWAPYYHQVTFRLCIFASARHVFVQVQLNYNYIVLGQLQLQSQALT